MTTLTPPTDPDQTGNPYPVDSTTHDCCGGIGGHTQECGVYLPDRYDRLTKCAGIYADGTDFGDNFITGDMVKALADNLRCARALDGLTEHDADTVGLLTILDFPRGVPWMAWRISEWASDDRSVDRPDDNQFAVVSVLARVLAITAAAFVGDEFEKAQQHYPDDEPAVANA